MTAKEIVKALMKEQNISNAEMAAKLNISQATMWDRLNPQKTNNMTVDKLNELLRQLGYELAVLPRGKTKKIEGSYLVEDRKKVKPTIDLEAVFSGQDKKV